MAAIIVQLECLTNMHVGNGDVNFNIIDNEVERDVTTGYPTVNASGVKGALREFFKKKGIASDTVNSLFGSEEKSGKLKFLSADMLAIPMRASAGEAAYYLVSTQEALAGYKEKCKLFINSDVTFSETDVKGCDAEGISLPKVTKVSWGEEEKNVYILGNEEFASVSLPVIARNKLEDGRSTNLWYEEVVPHKALFSFAVLAEDTDGASLTEFVNVIKNNPIVQFGGNASIGYGLCKVSVKEA